MVRLNNDHLWDRIIVARLRSNLAPYSFHSRPYVAMLIDQNKLKGATVSAGGHRRVSRAAVMEWHTRHQVTDKAADLRSAGKKAGDYKSTEADAVRRIKALAKNR